MHITDLQIKDDLHEFNSMIVPGQSTEPAQIKNN